MNPLDILYAWQSALLALVIVGLTQGAKAAIEAYLTLKNVGTAKTGKELRGEIAVIDRAILPLVPLVSGALLGAFVPLRPEALVDYVSHQTHGQVLAYSMWGAAIGQFSDYLYQRFKRMLPAQPTGTSNPPPAPAPPQEEDVPPVVRDAPEEPSQSPPSSSGSGV